MAKKSTAKSKVVSGSSKKSSITLTKRTALFGLVGILAFSSVAGFAWQKWQDHQLKAKALTYVNMTSLVGGTYVNGRACRQNGTYNIHMIAGVNSGNSGKVRTFARGNGLSKSSVGSSIDVWYSVNSSYVVLLAYSTYSNATYEYSSISVNSLKLC